MSLKDRTLCVVCHLYADSGRAMRTDCGHWTHTECWRSLDKPKDYENCPRCLGYVMAPINGMPENEPVTDDGIDYVMNPPTKTSLSMLRGAAAQILSVLSRNKRTDTANPFSLLAQGPYQMSIESIIGTHGIGLQHMIKAGVTIDDFLTNGYSLKDLQLFKDLTGLDGRGQDRAQQALYALKMTADHLRDYGSSLLPIAKMRDELGITPEKICYMYGLGCPPGGFTLSSPASEDWTARDVLELGFTMDDLLDYAGLEYQEQYFALEPTTEDELNLKVVPAHAERLRSLEAEQQETEIERQMAQARITGAEAHQHPRERELPTPAYMIRTQTRNHYIPDGEFCEEDELNPRRTRHGFKSKK